MENKKLKVWWIPQVPMKSFNVEVSSLKEADLLLNTLADYDMFQFENDIKDDYANAGGLQIWDESEEDWIDWWNEEGEDFDQYRERCKEENLPLE